MHKWLNNDNGVECYVCGIHIDFRTESETGGNFTDYFEGAHDVALSLAPWCQPSERAHHFELVPHPSEDPDQWALECYYGDASGDEPYLGPGEYNPECIGDNPPKCPVKGCYGVTGHDSFGPDAGWHISINNTSFRDEGE